MSTISSSVIINQSDIDNETYTWPVTINSGTQENSITITLGTNIELSNVSQYFIIGSEYITINGNNKLLTITNVTNYPGFVQNGYVSSDETIKTSGFNNVTIKDLTLTSNNSTLADYQGWICQSGFAYNTIQYTVNINNCINSGIISGNYSGGIFGAYSLGTATSCINNGLITDNGNLSDSNRGGTGGIFGGSSSGITVLCINNGEVQGDYSGGIFGWNSYGTATSCINNGLITDNGNLNDIYIGLTGGIFGGISSGTASSCINNGNIQGYLSGGIFGTGSRETASSCINNGNIQGYLSGGIFGTGSTGTSSSCTNNGIIRGDNSGGIFGAQSSGTANNCINNGLITDNGNINNNSNGLTGGIFGTSSSGIASSCINKGEIRSENSGGIFASYTLSGTANNCISISNIIGYKAGGIFGAYADNKSISNNSIVVGKLVGLLTGIIYGYRGNDTINGYVNYEIYSLTTQYANSGLICQRVIELFKKNDYDANNAFPIYSYYMNKYSLIKLSKKAFQEIY